MGEVVEREPGANNSKVLLARTCERVCSFVAKFVFCLTGTVPNEAGDHRAGRLANPRHSNTMGPKGKAPPIAIRHLKPCVDS